MRAWIIAGLIIVISSFMAFFYYMYTNISEPLIARENEAIRIAKEETELVEVVDIDFYHGRRSYQVIEGTDKNGEEIYVWVEELTDEQIAENKEPRIFTKKKKEGITKDEVRQIVQNRLEIKELVSIRLGMIGETPIYEVTYVDESDRHSFYYLSFEDGSYVNRHYRF